MDVLRACLPVLGLDASGCPNRTSTAGDGDFQPDTFHAVSHRLGVFAKRLQKTAY